jgi:hypothetical protein
MSNDQKLADAIIAMAKLSPGERATVMSVVERMRLGQSETAGKSALKAKPLRKPVARDYTPDERSELAEIGSGWSLRSFRENICIVQEMTKRFSARYPRSEKIIRKHLKSYAR